MRKKYILISYSTIRNMALIYITLPLFCFLFGWLKLYFSIPVSLATLFCIWFAIKYPKGKEVDKEKISVLWYVPLIVAGFSFLYAFFCGVGRLWAQSKDYPWRNAIFRDLMLKDWPVLYEKYDGALVYYIGQWLPAALIGKIFKMLGISDETVFRIGNIVLLIYVTIGLTILFFLLLSYFKSEKIKTILFVILLFVFFSGMDIVASIEPLGANGYHLEWWAKEYQYSSFTTCMCWVFNQALIPWICTVLLVKERTVANYVFIGMACILSGPFPFVGFFIYAITFGIIQLVSLIKKRESGKIIKSIFSPSNVLATLLIFPFIGAYLVSNAAITGAGGVNISNAVGNIGTHYSFGSAAWNYIKFVLLEFGIVSALIYRKYKKNPLYYITVIVLLIFPFIRMGYSADFTMRASIPAILMLYLFCVRYLLEEKEIIKYKTEVTVKYNNKEDNKKKRIDSMKIKKYIFFLLIICLILGAATPGVEFIRGFRQVRLRGINDVMTDYIYSLDGEGPFSIATKTDEEMDGSAYSNFVALDLENHLFFKYFARK